MKRRITTVLVVATIGLLAVLFLRSRPSVESVMRDFYRDDAGRAEDMLMDPLILHTDLVKARVIEEVKGPKMPRRRYAIGFLGVARVTEALPVLRMILSDEDEEVYFRADALDSIYQITKSEGLSLARGYSARDDFLGYVASGLVAGSHKPFERTYAQAAAGYHE